MKAVLIKVGRALSPVLLLTGLALAHPMGNLSVNHYMRLEPGAKGIEATYVLDLAELPTFEMTQGWNLPPHAGKNVLEAKAREQAREWVRGLTFTENGKSLTPKIESTDLAVLDGAGNLPVFRISTKLHVPAAGGRLEYADRNYSTRAGWREIVIGAGPGADISKASNGDTDISQALTSYPQDPTKAPPQNTAAWLEWKPVSGPVSRIQKPVIVAAAPAAPAPGPSVAAPPAPPVAAGQARDVRPPETQAMGTIKRNDAISKILRMETISWPLLATLIGLSFWFGALHALEPGHGKTMVAAYLVGARGTPKHAALLGGMVTFTHTISVFILGLVTMFLSRYIMPDRISKVLGIVSGLSIIWIGGMLLWRRARKLRPHHHHHRHGTAHVQDHEHHRHGGAAEHTHTHDHAPLHAHSHDHGHAHAHDHADAHGLNHDHAHEHHHHGRAAEHTHTHDHAPLHAHSHDHDHDHTHAHDHAHPHALDHAHDHEHHHHGGAAEHTHTHDHTPLHAHSHDHEHDQAHTHSHGAFTHTHDGHTHSHVPDGEISLGSLIALGASGGLVPCPSALILLLSAISIGRVGLGMLLLVAFSLGLALVLTATGMFVLYAKNLLPEQKRKDNAFFRVMPVLSAAAIVLIGVVMTSVSLGWIPANRFIG